MIYSTVNLEIFSYESPAHENYLHVIINYQALMNNNPKIESVVIEPPLYFAE